MTSNYIVVFENDKERTMMSADVCHNWHRQKNLFGTETAKLIELCKKLFRASLEHRSEDEERLLTRIYGIAKSHNVSIKWYGRSEKGGACEPDRFLVSGRGHERLAFIQV